MNDTCQESGPSLAGRVRELPNPRALERTGIGVPTPRVLGVSALFPHTQPSIVLSLGYFVSLFVAVPARSHYISPMPVKRVDPDDAAELLSQGWTYVDVRSVAEFDRGHPAGAYNVPMHDFVPGQGLKPNPKFLDDFQGRFGCDDKLVVGCKSGGRSAQAAKMLAEAGYTSVVDMRGGFLGETNAQGETTCAGWEARGLPCSTLAEPGRSYD